MSEERLVLLANRTKKTPALLETISDAELEEISLELERKYPTKGSDEITAVIVGTVDHLLLNLKYAILAEYQRRDEKRIAKLTNEKPEQGNSDEFAQNIPFNIANLFFWAIDDESQKVVAKGLPPEVKACNLGSPRLIPVFEGLRRFNPTKDEFEIIKRGFKKQYALHILREIGKLSGILDEIFSSADLLRPELRIYFLDNIRNVILYALWKHSKQKLTFEKQFNERMRVLNETPSSELLTIRLQGVTSNAPESGRLSHITEKGSPVSPNTNEILKSQAKEHLQILAGNNQHGRKIMSDQDFHRLSGYVDAMIENESVPSGIEPVSNFDLPSGHLLHLFYQIHRQLYGMKPTREYFFDFLRAVFPKRLSSWERDDTIKKRWSAPPGSWKEDLKKMKGDFGD